MIEDRSEFMDVISDHPVPARFPIFSLIKGIEGHKSPSNTP